MPRVKGGPRQKNKHKKVLKLAKGFRGTRSKLFKRANEAVVRKGKHAFEGRKQKRRDIRRLWISRINAALSAYDIRYSQFINALNRSELGLNRKMLSEMAINDPKGFESVVNTVKSHLSK